MLHSAPVDGQAASPTSAPVERTGTRPSEEVGEAEGVSERAGSQMPDGTFSDGDKTNRCHSVVCEMEIGSDHDLRGTVVLCIAVACDFVRSGATGSHLGEISEAPVSDAELEKPFGGMHLRTP